jgi:hypothetical protein
MNNGVADEVFGCHLDTLSWLDLALVDNSLLLFIPRNGQMGGTNGLFVQIYTKYDYSS